MMDQLGATLIRTQKPFLHQATVMSLGTLGDSISTNSSRNII